MKNQGSIIEKRMKYYKRNYLTLMMESFFFTFACTIFSYQTVLPVYISKLTENPFFISLIAVVYFGLSYGSSVLSCVIGVNTRSPKWASIIICGLQRVGFLLIYLSTFLLTDSVETALMVFFISFSVYSISAGMSSPMFALLVATAIPKNIGSFYGSYSLVGAGAGVFASWLLKKCYEYLAFPMDYRIIFLIGFIMAIIASFVVAVGIKEVVDVEDREKIRFVELPHMFRSIIKENKPFRNFVVVRMVIAVAEFSVPFYIIKVGSMNNVPLGFVGIMSTVLLVANMCSGKIVGWIGDRGGPMKVLRLSCICGTAAAMLALTMTNYQWGFLLFILVSFAVNGVNMSSSLANIMYAEANRTPIYAAANGLIIAPIYMCASFIGGIISTKYSINIIFIIAVCVYCIGSILTFSLERKVPFTKI